MKNLSKLYKNESGSIMVLFALALTAIIGVTALVTDVGYVSYEKARMQNAVDAASLAGAQELVINPGNARVVTRAYLENNGMDPDDAEITITGKKISVSTSETVDYFFAHVLGIKTGDLNVSAVAGSAALTGVQGGLRPFVIADQTLNFGATYVLKNGGGDGITGNFGAVALDGKGAIDYKNNITYGYDGFLRVGDYVDTEPGNMSGPTSEGITNLLEQCTREHPCTFDDHDANCPKIITILIVESLDVAGRKEVRIVGFASFFLEGVAGSGNDSIVTGKFIKMVGKGEMSETQTDYGLSSVKLYQ